MEEVLINSKKHRLVGVPYGKAIFLNRFRRALKQIRRHFKEIGVPLPSLKENNIIRSFAEHYQLTIVGHPRAWIYHLYMSGDNDIVGREDPTFYASDEWLKLRKQVLKHYGKVCMKCGCESNICVDHIKPRSKFPELALDFDNMQVLCSICNLIKGDRHTTDYRQPLF